MKKVTQEIKLPKTLVLNYKTWRCGGDTGNMNSHGTGSTSLRNPEGYECCLGQFASQCGVPKNTLLNVIDPQSLNEDYNIFINGFNSTRNRNSVLSARAIRINDSEHFTIKQKIQKLKKLLAENGHKLVVKNLPEKYK